MRVFVAGASGAIGRRLVPQLIYRGHEVTGTYRSPRHAGRVSSLGATSVQLDLLDEAAVRKAVLDAKPDAIVHEATAPSDIRFSRNMDRTFAQTNRLRTDGTDNLLAAARETGVRRVVAQSFASPRYARQGGMVKTEDDPVDPDPPATIREGAAAMNHVDQAVTDAGGIALRYGGFYGASNDALATMSTVSSILDDVRDACMRPSVAPLEYATRWEDADALACIGNHTREAVEHEKEVIMTHISTTTAAVGTQ